MKILIVKMTSMGDLLHLLPALTDLQEARSGQGIEVDWLVEENFSEIPRWHPLVTDVIPVEMRQWRGLRMGALRPFFRFLRALRKKRYDLVIDAQGLIKSALLARLAKRARGAQVVGFSGASIKESPAAWFYTQRVASARSLHAVERLRSLFAGAFGWQCNDDQGRYNLVLPARTSRPQASDSAQVVYVFHGTTWDAKHVPEAQWRSIIEQLCANGFLIRLCWGNETERLRAERLASSSEHASVVDKSTLLELAYGLKEEAAGAIAVDTGLGHLAAGLGIPCVSIYGATDSNLTGTYGQNQRHLNMDYACAPCLLKKCVHLSASQPTPPCYDTLSASMVCVTLTQLIAQSQTH